jgi:hypothetical protein
MSGSNLVSEHQSTVGARLPAMAVFQALKMFDLLASSQASQLPQGDGLQQ